MDDLDAAIAMVYAQPPSGFVSARAALVKELKAAKRKDDAARVAALRRPTKLAWAVGEAVRRAPDSAAAYFDAIAGLAEPAGSGGTVEPAGPGSAVQPAGPGSTVQPTGDLRQRTADLRRAVSELVAVVEGVEPGQATAALLATAADPEAVAALRLGRLAEVPAGGGFGGMAVGPEAAAEPERPASGGDSEQGTGGEPSGRNEDDGDAARAEAEERERREQEAQARAERLAALEAERDQTAAAEEAAARRVEAAETAVEQARAELERATRALDEAREAASAAAARRRELAE